MRYLALLVSLLLSVAALNAEHPIVLTIHAQAIESPVLKYRLLPEETELKPGDAVPILLRLPWEQQTWMQKVAPTLYEWSERPLSAPEWKTFQQTLPDNFYREMKRAAFRREAHWEYPIGEQAAYFILLPDAQGLRMFVGHGLAARIRYHLSRGELNEAREGILVGLANSRHIAQTPFFVNQLVAVAIQQSMLQQTTELMAQPASPNLYWALSTLPTSLLEVDRAASLEGSLLSMTFPAMNDLDRPRDAEEWRKMADQLVDLLTQLGELPPEKRDASLLERFLEQLSAAGAIHRTSFVKLAREELPTLLNLSPDQVAAMSDEEAAIRWYVHIRLNHDQQASALLRLPPREAFPRLAELGKETAQLREKIGGKGFDFLDPGSLYLSSRSVHRRVQALRIIEAVRHHLAKHAGNLPQSLDDIHGVPIPHDPLTDKPFAWKVAGNTATLSTPPLPDTVKADWAKAHHLEYRIEVK